MLKYQLYSVNEKRSKYNRLSSSFICDQFIFMRLIEQEKTLVSICKFRKEEDRQLHVNIQLFIHMSDVGTDTVNAYFNI